MMAVVAEGVHAAGEPVVVGVVGWAVIGGAVVGRAGGVGRDAGRWLGVGVWRRGRRRVLLGAEAERRESQQGKQGAG